MNEYIHTFSLERTLAQESFNTMKKRMQYKWNSDTETFSFIDYVRYGVRIEVKNRSEKEVQFDKKHNKMKLEIIVTLHKLIYFDKKIGVLNNSQIAEAMNRLERIFIEIEDITSINLVDKLKVKRVDITKDIYTESDAYTLELIRIIKLNISKIKSGCHLTSKEALMYNKKENKIWSDENAVFYKYDYQGLNAKAYNKKNDTLPEEYRQSNDFRGWLRFEVSLSQKFLLDKLYLVNSKIKHKDIYRLLIKVLDDAELIMQLCIKDKVYKGEIYSKDLLIKKIESACGTKIGRLNKMIDYIEFVNNDDGIEVSKDKKIRRIEKYFKQLKLSPIYCKNSVLEMLSFDELFDL